MSYTAKTGTIHIPKIRGMTKTRTVPEFVYDTGWRVQNGYHIKAQLAGYYSRVSLNELEEMEKWLETNAAGMYLTFGDGRIYLEKEEDVSWFMLRWG